MLGRGGGGCGLVGIWTLEGWDVGKMALCARVRRSCHGCMVERTEGGKDKRAEMR
jgi:hypothetical protein